MKDFERVMEKVFEELDNLEGYIDGAQDDLRDAESSRDDIQRMLQEFEAPDNSELRQAIEDAIASIEVASEGLKTAAQELEQVIIDL